MVAVATAIDEALAPISVASLILLCNDEKPSATLSEPVVFTNKLPIPIAVLALPVAFENND